MSDAGSVSRRGFLQAAGAAAAGTVAGCASQGGGSDRQSADVYNRISASLTTLDPIGATDDASAMVITQVFDTLVGYPDGRPTTEGLLAAGYEANDEGTAYTFRLREATFHDGSAVSAEDVVYSLERLAASPHSRRSSFLLDVLGVDHDTRTVTEDGAEREVYDPGSLAVTAVDDRTVRIELRRPFVSVLGMLAAPAFSVVPEGIVGDVEGYEGKLSHERFATEAPVGCGPFRFGVWEQGTEVEVERFESYHGPVPEIAGVHWQIIEGSNARYNYAMNRNADTFAIPTAKYDPEKVEVRDRADGIAVGTYGPVRNDATLQYSRRAELITYFLGFNMANVPRPIRRAFAHAVDQRAIVENVFKRRGRAAVHFTPPGIFPRGPEFYDEHAREYPYDATDSQLDRAREIVEAAGYGPENPYQIRWTQYDAAVWTSMAKLIRDQVRSAHIDMEIERVKFSTLTSRGRRGDLDVYTLGWSADYPAPHAFLQLLNPPDTITGGEEPPVSFLDWSSGTGDAADRAADAWKRIREHSGPGEAAARTRAEAALAMEEANWEDVGVLPLYHPYGEQFSYDWVDIEPYGAMGASTQQFTGVSLGDRGA